MEPSTLHCLKTHNESLKIMIVVADSYYQEAGFIPLQYTKDRNTLIE